MEKQHAIWTKSCMEYGVPSRYTFFRGAISRMNVVFSCCSRWRTSMVVAKDASLWVRWVFFDDRRTRAHFLPSWIPDPIFWYWVSTSFIVFPSPLALRELPAFRLGPWPPIRWQEPSWTSWCCETRIVGCPCPHLAILSASTKQWCTPTAGSKFPKGRERWNVTSLMLSLEKIYLSSAFVIAALSSALILSSNCFLNSLSFFPLAKKTEVWRLFTDVSMISWI